MGFLPLITSALGSSASLGAACQGAFGAVAKSAISTKAFFTSVVKYAVQRELASEIGPLATLIPMRGFDRALSREFNKQYAKTLPSQLSSIAKPELKPIMFNSFKVT